MLIFFFFTSKVPNRWRDGLLRRHKLVLDRVPDERRRHRHGPRRPGGRGAEDPARLGLQRRHVDAAVGHRVVPAAVGLGVHDQHGRRRASASRLRRLGRRAEGHQADHQLCE